MRPALSLVALALMAAAFAAGGTILNGNGARRTIAAKGGDVTVNGNRNTLRVTGSAPTLRVAGNRNTVRVARVGTIEVTGNDNRIEWSGAPGGKPKIVNVGNRNTVVRK